MEVVPSLQRQFDLGIRDASVFFLILKCRVRRPCDWLNLFVQRNGAQVKHARVWCKNHQRITPSYSFFLFETSAPQRRWRLLVWWNFSLHHQTNGGFQQFCKTYRCWKHTIFTAVSISSTNASEFEKLVLLKWGAIITPCFLLSASFSVQFPYGVFHSLPRNFLNVIFCRKAD